MTHDVCQQFRSPTLNLIIPKFVEFCEDLENNLKKELIASEQTSNGYPVCMCGDIEIIGVHYKNCDDLIDAWNRRRNRVNFDNILLIATDNFVKNKDLADRYDRLPYPKICFTSQKINDYDWMVFLPEFEGKEQVGDSLRYTNIFGVRIFEKHFDCVKWLNDNIGN